MKLRLAFVLVFATATLSAQTHPTGLTFSVGQASNDVGSRSEHQTLGPICCSNRKTRPRAGCKRKYGTFILA